MRVAVVQMDIVWEDREANFAKTEGFLNSAGTPLDEFRSGGMTRPSSSSALPTTRI